MFYCYILESKINSSYYVGSCENISKRLSQHNKASVPATKRYAPWLLIHKEQFATLREAKKKEEHHRKINKNISKF